MRIRGIKRSDGENKYLRPPKFLKVNKLKINKINFKQNIHYII